MGWTEVDNKHKILVESIFVTCEDQFEMDRLKETIKEEFPYLDDAAIDSAFDHCCTTMQPPRARNRFIKCLSGRLGGAH